MSQIQLPAAPASRTRIPARVPADGEPVTVLCSGDDVFHRFGGPTVMVLVGALYGVVFEYAAGIWYATPDEATVDELERLAGLGGAA